MNLNAFYEINHLCLRHGAKLIAVTKGQSIEDILHLYNAGQRAFAENRAQALLQRRKELPADIAWHMIGHLQRNKVKSLVPFVAMIHSVDSLALAIEINLRAAQCGRIVPVLLEIKIGKEATKQGYEYNTLLNELEAQAFTGLDNLLISGVMGIASLTSDHHQIRNEFAQLKANFMHLKSHYFSHPEFCEISMGMSSDYSIALEMGSTMLRIGSKLFEK